MAALSRSPIPADRSQRERRPPTMVSRPLKQQARHMIAALACAVPLLAGAAVCRATCLGDCDADGQVTVNELVRAVSIALGNVPLGGCERVDADGDGRATIDELTGAIGNAV